MLQQYMSLQKCRSKHKLEATETPEAHMRRRYCKNAGDELSRETEQPAERFPEAFEVIPQASEVGAPRIARVKLGTPLAPERTVSIARRTLLNWNSKPKIGLLGRPAVTQR